MEFDFKIDFNGPSHGAFSTSNTSSTRGVDITETTHLFGDHSLEGMPCGNNHEVLGNETLLTNGKSTKQYFNLPDGGLIMAKKGNAGAGFMTEYQKVLYRANKEAPWELLAYKNFDMSFNDIERLRNFPDFVDLTSSQSKAVEIPWVKLKLDRDFTGLKKIMPGLTKGQAQQLKNQILRILM